MLMKYPSKGPGEGSADISLLANADVNHPGILSASFLQVNSPESFWKTIGRLLAAKITRGIKQE